MLSDVLTRFRLSAEVYHNARVCGDWQIQEGHLGQTCFHMPVEGACLLQIDGYPEQQLDTGDLVIFPHELPHRMCPVIPLEGKQQHLPYADSQQVPGTGLICGRIQFRHNGCHLLLKSLPEFFILKHADTQGWITPILALIQRESYRSDSTSQLLLNRLSELLFVYALRDFIVQQPTQVGVLALYAHPRLGKAVQAMHEKPSFPWSVAALAAEAMVSRTKFSNLFRETSGWTPMQYLTWWRMQLAWDLLASGTPTGDVAQNVGYQSESAFARVFKAEFATSVGSVRRGDYST